MSSLKALLPTFLALGLFSASVLSLPQATPTQIENQFLLKAASVKVVGENETVSITASGNQPGSLDITCQNVQNVRDIGRNGGMSLTCDDPDMVVSVEQRRHPAEQFAIHFDYANGDTGYPSSTFNTQVNAPQWRCGSLPENVALGNIDCLLDLPPTGVPILSNAAIGVFPPPGSLSTDSAEPLNGAKPLQVAADKPVKKSQVSPWPSVTATPPADPVSHPELNP
ncbi:MAG: hypothetical protein M1833_002832 [Piccolia ochrophora]|nr:MAG: hypothetical protein M1833_002832 [Piccolia ochrophora]